MSYGVSALPEPLRVAAFGDITASYEPVGSEFAHPIRWLLIQNLTDKAMYFSFDGDNDHFYLAAGATLPIDISSNRNDISKSLFIAASTFIFVRYAAAPSTGNVFVSALYARGD